MQWYAAGLVFICLVAVNTFLFLINYLNTLLHVYVTPFTNVGPVWILQSGAKLFLVEVSLFSLL